MKTAKLGQALGAGMLGALAALLAVPTAMSLAREGGAICFSGSACPLSAINPCVREPRLALLGRCALRLR